MYAIALLSLLPLALAAPAPIAEPAPIIEPRGAAVIPGKYIVKLKEGVSEDALTATIGKLGSFKTDHVYKAGSFKGFASKLDAATLEVLQNDPRV